MSRMMFAIAFAGLIFTAAAGTAHAAPISPLPAAAVADTDNVTDVQWRRCWRDRWGRLRCRGGGGWGPGYGAWGAGPGWGPGWGWGGGRNCWRDRWGQLRCRW